MTHQDTLNQLSADLADEGFEVGWGCLGGDWWGITVINDVSMVIITGGDGGEGAKIDDLAEHIGMGFYHDSDWVAVMPEAPTAWTEFLDTVRAWINKGTLPEDDRLLNDGQPL